MEPANFFNVVNVKKFKLAFDCIIAVPKVIYVKRLSYTEVPHLLSPAAHVSYGFYGLANHRANARKITLKRAGKSPFETQNEILYLNCSFNLPDGARNRACRYVI